MANKIEANALTFNDIFGAQSIYFVPVFQRRYVWDSDKVDAFLDSLLELNVADEKDRHFLGPIIVSERKAGGAARKTESWIIDGQQRLTTVFLVLSTLASMSAARQNFREDVCTYLFHQGSDKRLRPLIINESRDHPQVRRVFADLGFKDQVEYPQHTGEEDGDLWKAYRRIKTRFNSEINKELTAKLAGEKDVKREVQQLMKTQVEAEYLDKVFKLVLERMLVVFIELTKEEDPKQIFDTLNSAGLPLQNIDLVRNEVLGVRVIDDPQFVRAHELYRTRWEPLEKSMPGEMFDDYLFPYALVRNPRCRKSSLVNDLRDLWDAPVTLDSVGIIEDISRYVQSYLAIAGSDRSALFAIGADDIVLRYARFRRMGSGLPNSIYSFIFALHEAFTAGRLTKERYLRCLDMVESFLVRRSLDGIEPTGLHAVFKVMWEKTYGDPALFRKHIVESSTVKVPSDAELLVAIADKPLFKRSLANYIVFEFEKSFTEGDQLPDDYDLKRRLSLDHVMPQSPDFSQWSISEADFIKYKDTWANLVPLTPEANAQKGNQGWLTTREFYLNSTIFKSTRHFSRTYATWTIDDLKGRSLALGEWAKSRWVF